MTHKRGVRRYGRTAALSGGIIVKMSLSFFQHGHGERRVIPLRRRPIKLDSAVLVCNLQHWRAMRDAAAEDRHHEEGGWLKAGSRTYD